MSQLRIDPNLLPLTRTDKERGLIINMNVRFYSRVTCSGDSG